jgi:kinesin family protein 3/17
MEEKLLVGAKHLDKAAKQEHELRKATIELEERRRQELELARELEKREEDQILVEEQFESLQDEVDAKSRKLKKVWNKYQSMKSMLEDTESDLNRAREDAGNIIRDLKRQNKLKQLIVDYFIPPDIVELLSRKAQWDEASDEYVLMRKNLVGNAMKGRRPVSATGLRRPESQFAKHRKKFDQNPRYRADNISNFGLDMPDRTTADYEGPAMSQRVKAALDAALIGEDEDEIEFDSPENLPEFNPYLNYPGDDNDRDGDRDRDRDKDRSRDKRSSGRPKSSSRRRNKSDRRKRPGSAARVRGRGSRKEADVSRERDEFGAMYSRESQDRDAQEEYPTARGLVGR